MPVPATPTSLLCKLGSISVHAAELLGPAPSALDAAALRGLLADPEVRAWQVEMAALALIPVPR